MYWEQVSDKDVWFPKTLSLSTVKLIMENIEGYPGI